MLFRIRYNNFIGVVELFVKFLYIKIYLNNFFNNIYYVFKKKDWILNYDSLLILREFFCCVIQIDKSGYQVFLLKNEIVYVMDKFFISFSFKDNGVEYIMIL